MVKTKILGKPGQPSFRGDVNQCPTCFTVFNSTHAFDKHRVGTHTPNTRRCLSDEEMSALGMRPNRYGRWVSKAMSETKLEDWMAKKVSKKA